MEKLKLTEEQRKAMDKIFQDHRATLIDLHANVEKAELAMEPLIGEDTPNEAKILAQIDKLAQARAELEKANARFLLALRAKLTPEQWKTLQANRPEHRGFGAEERRELRQERRNGQRPEPGGAQPQHPSNGGGAQMPPPPEGGPADHPDAPNAEGPGL